ncbi:FRG domain-containing protein [Francisella sp. 19X1-34]|nr:FRG domain-containing protein [Francisella sp. 19X1-34]
MERPISKVADYIERMYQKIGDVTTKNKKWLFRGQANENWECIPSIFRGYEEDKDQGVVKYEIEMIKKYCELLGKSQTNYSIDLLGELQHFGMPTRLLDITGNFLVALFFSVKDKDQKDKDGCIYIFDGEEPQYAHHSVDMSQRRESTKKFFGGHYPNNKLSQVTFEDDNLYNNLPKINEKSIAEFKKNYPDIINDIGNKSKKNNLSLDEKINYIVNSVSMYKPVIVRLSPSIPRVIAQDAYVILYKDIYDKEKKRLYKFSQYSSFFTSSKTVTIEKKDKVAIEKELSKYFNISSYSLYPETPEEAIKTIISSIDVESE